MCGFANDSVFEYLSNTTNKYKYRRQWCLVPHVSLSLSSSTEKHQPHIHRVPGIVQFCPQWNRPGKALFSQEGYFHIWNRACRRSDTSTQPNDRIDWDGLLEILEWDEHAEDDDKKTVTAMTMLTTTMMMMRCLVVSRRSSVFCPGASFWEIVTSATKTTINIVDSTSSRSQVVTITIIITVCGCEENEQYFLIPGNPILGITGQHCCQNYRPYVSSFSQISFLPAQAGIIIITIVIQLRQRHCGFLPPDGSSPP